MPTLCCSQLGESALVQIYPEGIRHIRADKRVNEWRAPAKKQIVQCAVNQRQVVLALAGGELVYFEMDTNGQLNEYTERKEMGAEVTCMALASVPGGELRTRFLAVGLADDTVRVVSLEPRDCLALLAAQSLPAPAESLCIVEMRGLDMEGPGLAEKNTLFLNIGLANGALLRTVLDPTSGDLLDTRTRYLGSRPVRLFKVSAENLMNNNRIETFLLEDFLCWLVSKFFLESPEFTVRLKNKLYVFKTKLQQNSNKIKILVKQNHDFVAFLF